MFENKLRTEQSMQNDPFADLNNEGNMASVNDPHNPFEEIFLTDSSSSASEVSPDLHFVEPHYVNSYVREDGTYVEGYWRDGDGDTSVDLQAEQGGGYVRSNPGDSIWNNLNVNGLWDV